jgi:hypothetical protein
MAACVAVVDEECVGSQLHCQGDGFALALVDLSAQLRKRLARGLNPQPLGLVGEPPPHFLRSLLVGQFRYDHRRNDHLAEQSRQYVHVLDQDQVAKWAGVGDDNHTRRRSESCGRLVLSLALLPQLVEGLAVLLEVIDRVVEWDAVVLQESVELVPRRNVQQGSELKTGDPVHPVRIDGERLQRGPGQILALLSELLNEVVRNIERDPHPASIGQPSGER